ncbi:FAD-dependent monooxygenase [Nonomuraea endophytica]|uniref:2-polyprenyl-6-methoxyphenol hydroxylase-like FAD-dependent oxidoreductase n=1 Tax=Nonomuraea endophytica TaxID=714136 RepID=A0A7W8A9J6_9ACTN|nr:FAD-dependent monooxygenase [Nonomuraea endophytica]MBB5082108.1 2-polyprenyl-6-methoxyphenol hydroxylase-like FAD-dependent oxidoreductase [Nonomuraea endophytica]
MTARHEVPVLIVGGGMSGLSAALFLSLQGVPCLLVERHADHSPHPRLSGLFPRVMEVLRQAGLERDLRALDEFEGREGRFIRAETLAGAEIASNPDIREDADLGPYTPAPGAILDQDQFEPLLRARAVELGADVRYHTELLEFRQDDDGVTAVVRDRGDGATTTVRAAYLLACDGDSSPIRERLGITRSGPGHLVERLGVLFRADLGAALRGRHVRICLTSGHGDLHVRALNRWGYGIDFDPSRDRIEDFTDERCAELVTAAVGLPGLEPEILHVQRWRITALIATRFREGRIFLVGDAAHAWPATGGFAGQACVLDAHNLAWKLAATLYGGAGTTLLDTYEQERLPVARISMDDSLRRMSWFHAAAEEAERPRDHATVAMGQVYRSSAILTEDPNPRHPDGESLEDPRRPTGRPGTRAPHLLIERHGVERSTVDLFGGSFVLLTDDPAWTEAAEEVGGLVAHRFGGDLTDLDGLFHHRYGIRPGGAVLVRPDGHIAWRSPAGDPEPARTLKSVLARVLG